MRPGHSLPALVSQRLKSLLYAGYAWRLDAAVMRRTTGGATYWSREALKLRKKIPLILTASENLRQHLKICFVEGERYVVPPRLGGG